MVVMKSYPKAIGLLFFLAMLAGCASTKVTGETPMTAPGLTRPNQIWVYDFIAAPADMPADSSLAGQVGAPSTPPTPEELEIGRKYGAMIAQEWSRISRPWACPRLKPARGLRRKSAIA